ncbi:MAG: hypothetical protein Q9225_000512 [Loekoesia sp. 1 TL-2023]
MSQILEHSNGSPSRSLKTSPYPKNGNNPLSARAPRPKNLGFGNIGENFQGDVQQFEAGPKSAPPQVNSFGQLADDDDLGSSSRGLFNERWLQRPAEMYVTDTRRSSIVTISPDKARPRPPRASNPASAYPSSTHLELLEAQYGIKNSAGTATDVPALSGKQPDCQIRSGVSSPFLTGKGHQANSAIFMGRGYDTLRAYVEMAADGQERSIVPELEQLMSTMLYLRGDGDSLPSMHHFGRDALRKFMYKCVLGSEDGSSKLSQEQPSGLIDVAGRRIQRQDLYEEMVHFLEDQLDFMTAPPDQGRHNEALHQDQASTSEGFSHPVNSSGTRNLNAGRHQGQFDQNGVEMLSMLRAPSNHEADHGRLPIHYFQNLNLGGPQRGNNAINNSDPRQSWNVRGLGEVYNKQQLSTDFAVMPGLGQGFQGSSARPYGQLSIDGQQQQYFSTLQSQSNQQPGPSVPPQLIKSPGIAAGPMYLPPPSPPWAFYPGHQAVPQGGPIVPWGPQFLTNPGFGMQQLVGPMAQPQFLPNPQMALSALPPQMSSWAPQSLRGMQPAAPQWPQVAGRVHRPASRSGSPMLGGRQSRAGRHVVSHVPLLPYRPGSDDMYPHTAVEGSSVRLQELTRNGGPSYGTASKPENIPFVETARQARPAERGVLKIGNIPYSLTKQEVLGLLGRNAKIVTPDIGVPIHIIMDRTTGKTMDCYVEFFSYGDAQAAFNKCLLRGSQLRLGDRVVDVAMSSQDALLSDLFPKAKNVEWQHGRPIIKDSDEPYNSGFKSFVTNEELLQLVSHAEKPHRSNYTQKCLQRPYECMISTLAKFPWFAVDRYTIRTRDEMFRQTLNLTTVLSNQLRRGHEAWIPHLSESLLTELLYAGLNAPAFSEYQRLQLCQAADAVGDKIRMSPMVPYWPFEVLGRKAGVEEDYVKVNGTSSYMHLTHRLMQVGIRKILEAPPAQYFDRPPESIWHLDCPEQSGSGSDNYWSDRLP